MTIKIRDSKLNIDPDVEEIRHLQFLPLLLTAIVFPTIITTYLIAVHLHHVKRYVPYISDAALNPPEMCLFTQMMNVVAFLGMLSVYIRNKELQMDASRKILPARIMPLIKVHLVLGFICCGGVSVLSCFQNGNVRFMHLIGAVSFFLCGEMMLYADIILSQYLEHTVTDVLSYKLKFLIFVSSVTTAVLLALFGICRSTILEIMVNDPDPAWVGVVEVCGNASALNEWLSVALILSYFLTLGPSFSNLALDIKVRRI